MISLNPPDVPSLELVISVVQPLSSQNLEYILYKSPANIAASSPPVPPLISKITFLSSSGSAGISRYLIFSSNSGRVSLYSDSSSLANSLNSLSDSFSKIFLASWIES